MSDSRLQALVKSATILVIDDDPLASRSLCRVLEKSGHRVLTAFSGEEGLALAANSSVDLVISDLEMPGINGLEVLASLKTDRPELEVMIVTGFGSLRSAITALRAGAADYVTKPFQAGYMSHRVNQVLRHASMANEVDRLRAILRQGGPGNEFVGVDPAILTLGQTLEAIAKTRTPVLLSGEPGSGRHYAAKSIHEWSSSTGPCATLDCRTAPEDASAWIRQAIRANDDGTVIFREVDLLDTPTQASLGMAIESARPRVIATCQVQAVQLSPTLRQSFGPQALALPPLRDRPRDLVLLAEHFLHQHGRRNQTPARQVSPAAAAILAEQQWPGNLNELRSRMEAAACLTKGPVVEPAQLALAPSSNNAVETVTIAELERRHIQAVLASVGNNRIEAAARLGINRSTLYRKLLSYDNEQDQVG